MSRHHAQTRRDSALRALRLIRLNTKLRYFSACRQDQGLYIILVPSVEEILVGGSSPPRAPLVIGLKNHLVRIWYVR